MIAYPGQVTRVKALFDRPGLFVWHCHIVDHEDNDRLEMLAINANDMEVASLVGMTSAAMTNDIMADMPDKGMLN